jgi:hypothetical protein
MEDIRNMYLLNTSVLLASFSQIEPMLKIILLLLSIGYTINRWYVLRKKTNIKEDEDNK